MAFFLLFAGILLVVVGAQGTQDKFFSLLSGDFTGPNNFFFWLVALLVVGALGFIKSIRPISDGLLILILISIVLSKNKGMDLFSSFNNQIKTGTSGNLSNTDYKSFQALQGPQFQALPNGSSQ